MIFFFIIGTNVVINNSRMNRNISTYESGLDIKAGFTKLNKLNLALQ